MSVIDCDYLPVSKVAFPPKLALLIVRKAAALATEFEAKALDQMNFDARKALQRGTDLRVIVRQLGLQG